ncbi:phosphate acetyltransferase [Campylobacter sp. 46490-21]|uniref:phosphate acetyltransferase n=1 Tax=Campylobacter magnus TaxID=3026462 RepID=UPI0023625EA1|nr:phosphate acetyltransferase [Campylobacter magnus]MDD0848476.1 phosphate acetyltransferase [Campylobacter magnus]
MGFSADLLSRARALKRVVVLPESDDERVLKAASKVLEIDGAKIILLGKKDEILARAGSLELSKAQFIDISTSEYFDDFASTLFELRKAKGMSQAEAKELILRPEYFGTMLVYKGIAHAMVSGAKTTTADTIRPALQFVKMKDGISTVSGAFVMVLDGENQKNERVWFFADCAITPRPSTEQLAGIALSTANTAKSFGYEPKVAFLSYSTGDSAKGEMIDFVKEALEIAQKAAPDIAMDGPMQFDAAVDSKVAKSKMPNSKVAGQANVFIFPDLNCGNITYKAVQRSANALAIGPILQGLKKPVNDLSRGCSVDDIVNTVLISALQE